MRALAALEELEQIPPLQPWLFRIAHNRALDLLRGRAVRAVESIQEAHVQDSSFASVDSKLASLFVLSVVNWILIWYRPDGDRTRDEIVESFIAMIENGLTPRKTVG